MSFLDIEGLDDLERQILSMGKNFGRLETKAIKEGAEIIRKEIEDSAPRSMSPRQPKKNDKWRLGDHAANHIETSKIIKKDGGKRVYIGTGPDDNSAIFYLKFHEWGTSKLDANPFMEPALQRKKEEAIDKVKEVISRGLIK